MSETNSATDSQDATTLEARAHAAHRRGDFKTALELYTKLANLGSDFSRYDAATILLHGWGGVQPNPIQAREWYEQLLGSGNRHLRQFSALKLGVIFEIGVGVPADQTRAFDYYKRLEDSNLAVGLLRLGILYEKGKGTSKDLDKAKALYRRAAHLDNVIARKCLGSLKVRTGEVASGYSLWALAILEVFFLSIFRRSSHRLATS